MYPNLFKGLGLKKEDLMKHTSHLVGFDGKVVIPEGQIYLLVIIGGKEVAVTFTIVSSFPRILPSWENHGSTQRGLSHQQYM